MPFHVFLMFGERNSSVEYTRQQSYTPFSFNIDILTMNMTNKREDMLQNRMSVKCAINKGKPNETVRSPCTYFVTFMCQIELCGCSGFTSPNIMNTISTQICATIEALYYKLEVRRFESRIRWFFFNLPNPSSRTMALESTQPLTEMSTRSFHGGKKRPARRADNLAAINEPNIWKCGSLNLSQP
jgi:hypothetical protein